MTLIKRNLFSLRSNLYRDFCTFKQLPGKQKLTFIWDYYKWRILACIATVIVISSFVSILWEGQKPCRLRICVVLNEEADCASWFSSFTDKLQSDGKPGAIDINFDQIFDYNSPYYYAHEMNVMSTISSGRMDVAICGEHLYQYLLTLHACFPLDQCLSDELFQTLSDNGKLISGPASQIADRQGVTELEDGIDGYYAVDLSGSSFFQLCNQASLENEPLYAVIISNTEHLDDCETLIRALTEA